MLNFIGYFNLLFMYMCLFFLFLKWSRFIFILIIFEFLMMSLFYMISLFYGYFIFFYFLCFSVVSSVLGVVLMVGLIKFYGCDFSLF